MQIAVKMFKSSMCYLIILFAFITPLSKVNANTNFIKKDVETHSTFSSEDQNNLTNFENDHILESHELMQQESSRFFKVPITGVNVPKQQNTFLDGKLIIHEEEPLIDEDTTNLFTVPTPTQEMHRSIRQNLQEKEPDPSASESLLELLVTIAGQPKRWNKLIGYINTILSSPITINPELVKQLEVYKTRSRTDEIKGKTKPLLKNTERELMQTYKTIEKNHTDSIQHMIIFLKNENSIKHFKKDTITSTAASKQSMVTTPQTDALKIVPQKLWSALTNTKSYDIEMRHEPVNQHIQNNFSIENDFDYDNNHTIDEQKFIDELHKLTFNTEKYTDLNKESKLTSNIVKNTQNMLNISKSNIKKHSKKFNANRWPLFQENNNSFTENFGNIGFSDSLRSESTTFKPPVKLKEWFSFRRVTSVPVSGYDKTRARNAYIAVSVIAPTMRKYYRSQQKQKTEIDPIVSQLLHLKPWNHRDNLKHMKKLREKWPIISTGEP